MVAVLVTGGNGQLGHALRKKAVAFTGMDVHFFTSSELDITDPDAIEKAFSEFHPDYIVNTAAYTAVDKAESEPETAFAINAEGVGNLAQACRKHNAVLLHVSTDFVFRGDKDFPYSEEDETDPQGVYGSSKLEGEKKAATWEKHFIIRTSWVYSEFGTNFMKTMLRLGHERDTLGVVDDQMGTPTNANDLAEAMLSIIEKHSKSAVQPYGIYNYSNQGQCSWYEFAGKIFEKSGTDIALRRISTSEYPTPARRPPFSVLSKDKIQKAFGLEIKSWQESLSGLLDKMST